MHGAHRDRARAATHRAFTLVELLIVVSIIALLIGILLPALAGARASAWLVVAGTNARSAVQGLLTAEAESRKFPFAYYYPSTRQGIGFRSKDQQLSNPVPANGYVHWTQSLFGDGIGPGSDAFESPAVTNGGAPATNPGPNPNDWERGQVNDQGQSIGAEFPEDRQVKRLAFTANAAVIARNKLNATGGIRKNRQVKSNEISDAARTILITEFYDSPNWDSLKPLTGENASGGVIKSHRPVTPFLGRSAGQDVYKEPDATSGLARFAYPEINELFERFLKQREKNPRGMIEHPLTTLMAVGNHHPGGQVNFGFVDGHVKAMKLEDTIKKRLWGDRFWSITGYNAVYEPPVTN